MNGGQIENKQNVQEHRGRLPSSRDRRAHVRRAPESLTYVELGESYGGIVGDISENGLSTTAAEMLVAELLSCIRFRLPDSARCIETSAQIVWLSPSRKGAGVEFIDLPEDARNLLREWISSGGSPSDLPERTRQPQGNEKPFRAMPSPRNVRPLAIEIINIPGLQDWELEKFFPSEFAPAPLGALAHDSIAPPPESPGAMRNSTAPTVSARESSLLSPEVRCESACHSALDSGAEPSLLGRSRDAVASLSPPRASQPIQFRKSPPAFPSFTRHQSGDSILKLGGPTAGERIAAAPTRRNGVVIAVVGILLAGLVFTADLTDRNGYLENWLGHGDAFKQVANASSDNSSDSSANSPVNMNNSPDNSATAPASADATSDANASRTSPEDAPQQAPSASMPQRKNSSEPIRAIPHSTDLNPPSQRTAEGTNTNVTPENAFQQTPWASPVHAQPSAGETQAVPNVKENPLPGNASASRAPHGSSPGSATASASLGESLGPMLATPLVGGSSPFRVILPEEPVSASSSVAISSLRLVPLPPGFDPQTLPTKNLLVGRLLKRVDPSYPLDAVQQRIEGTVRLHAVIGEDGKVQSVEPVSGPTLLVGAAVNAVREWRYGPTLFDGHRVQIQEDIKLAFRLPD
jgi:TonB family protein